MSALLGFSSDAIVLNKDSIVVLPMTSGLMYEVKTEIFDIVCDGIFKKRGGHGGKIGDRNRHRTYPHRQRSRPS
jgi:hypothetical protein